MKSRCSLFLVSLSLSLIHGHSSQAGISSPAITIPRTTKSPFDSQLWTPSKQVNRQGFLKRTFQRNSGPYDPRGSRRLLRKRPHCLVRQVPGDGNCLFHSISLCLRHSANQTHWDIEKDLDSLYEHSRMLRKLAVDCLEGPDEMLYLQCREWVSKQELLESNAQQYGISVEEYCQTMREDGVWGGGPEIVALANVLRRPIHVYELLDDDGNKFGLQRMACFGSPAFDNADALHVLSADARFPDVEPGNQLPSGNHFMSIFPLPRQQLRGGADMYWEDDDERGGKDGLEGYTLDRTSQDDGWLPFHRRFFRACRNWWNDLL